jgi:hypothetical protein
MGTRGGPPQSAHLSVLPWPRSDEGSPGMHCPRCQHENRPQAKFCEECTGALAAASPTARSYADLTSEVETLRRALSDGLERETATSEILHVISSSPADVQPVFAAVLTSAARLCDAFDATIFQVDGD